MPSTHFGKMDYEKLIEIVRNYEFLYNLQHPKYMDHIKKEMTWKEIGEKMKQSGAACKQRWQCLRDAYRRALNKKKGKSGQAAKQIKPWKYEAEMAFVGPFFKEKKYEESVVITSDDGLSNNDDDNDAIEPTAENPNIDEVEVTETPADVSDANNTRIDEVPQNESQQRKFVKKPRLQRKKSVHSNIHSGQSASAILMAKLLEDQSQHKLEPPRGQDEIDRFFLNISDTVKKFSPYLQAVAKNKIFTMISEMELQQLAPPSYLQSPSATSSYTYQSPQSASATPMPTSPDNWMDTQSASASTRETPMPTTSTYNWNDNFPQ